MNRCYDRLNSDMNADNVGEILEQAVLYDQSDLMKKCLEFYSVYAQETLEKFNDTHLSKDTLNAIVSCETIEVDEFQMFEVCHQWSTIECKSRNLDPTAENRRNTLDSILDKIHFCNMTGQEFASKVSPTGLLPMEKELDVFRFLNSPENASCAPFKVKERKLLRASAQLPERFYNISSDNHESETIKRSGLLLDLWKPFIVLGFVFTQTGDFNIWVNDEIHEKMSVSKAGVDVYLKHPVRKVESLCRIHISTVKEMATDRTEDECEVSWEGSHCVSFKLSKYGRTPLPFKTIIFAA